MKTLKTVPKTFFFCWCHRNCVVVIKDTDETQRILYKQCSTDIKMDRAKRQFDCEILFSGQMVHKGWPQKKGKGTATWFYFALSPGMCFSKIHDTTIREAKQWLVTILNKMQLWYKTSNLWVFQRFENRALMGFLGSASRLLNMWREKSRRFIFSESLLYNLYVPKSCHFNANNDKSLPLWAFPPSIWEKNETSMGNDFLEIHYMKNDRLARSGDGKSCQINRLQDL